MDVWERTLQAEETARAKALSREYAWCVLVTARIPVWVGGSGERESEQ